MSKLELDPTAITETAVRLHKRILERFPDSGLGKVAGQLAGLAREGGQRARELAKPNWFLRGLSVLLIAATLALMIWLVSTLGFRGFKEIQDFVAFLDPALSATVLLGAALFSVRTLETRRKRDQALEAMHELRAMAHVIDMHQLTKDPETAMVSYQPTESSPDRKLSPFELSRYLDYCAEMLSIISKIGALYAQGFRDSVALGAVDQVESMTTGLSRKIWQKMTLIEGVQGPRARA